MQQEKAKAARRQKENAKKAKEFANKEFPNEKWITVEDGIYLSPHRPIGAKSSYLDELRDAQILKSYGNTVYLVPEIRSESGKKYDAIVNELKFEFKNVGGNENTLFTHFLKSRSQAPNVFINLETSNLTHRQVISTLYSARNSKARLTSRGTIIGGYAEYNKFSGGRIILKLKGHQNMIYLKVDDLKARKKHRLNTHE